MGGIRRLILLALALAALAPASAARGAPLTVAAYYYPWYAPDGVRWGLGYARSQLTPPQPPALGQYASNEPAVIAQHFAWAQRYGVGVFFASWDGPGTFADGTIRDGLFPAPARGPTQIALLYESLARFPLGPDARIHLDAAGVARLVSDFDYLARTYFSLPGYYEIDGRPVVVVYASRVYVGLFAQAIHEIRARLESSYGVDPYLIGDEVDWDDPPDPARIALFDAITGYTPYSRTQPAGWPDDTAFAPLDAARQLLFRAVAAREGVAFIPGSLPGYDDRGERLAEDHHVLPRSLGPGAAPDSLFRETLGIGGTLVDPSLGLLTVTSWNEWNEDTQIEPTIPVTAAAGPAALTQGYPFTAYGTSLLDDLARFALAWDDAPGARAGAVQSR